MYTSAIWYLHAGSKKIGSSTSQRSPVFVRHLSSEHYLSFAVKMLADALLILFISMATALLSEGKYLLLINSKTRLLRTRFSA